MSNYQKELEKIKNNPKNVAFSKIKNILEKAGYACSNNGSSRYQFRKNGEETITIPFETSKSNLCKNGVKSFGGINERFEILPVATL